MAANLHNLPTRIPKSVVLFTVAYLLPAVIAALWTRNGEFVFYSVVLVILISIVFVVHRRCHLSLGVLWGLSLWGLAHLVGGLVPVPDSWPIEGSQRVVYSWWLVRGFLKFDQVVHVYGFFVTTCLCWGGFSAIVRGLEPGKTLHPDVGILVLCAAGSMGFGALNEVIEFTATLLVPSTNVGGYVNTGWDLVSTLVGATAAACWLRWSHRKMATREPGHPGKEPV